MQQGGRQRRASHSQFGQDCGDRERMGDVRLSGSTPLIFVQQLGGLVGTFDEPQVCPGVVLLDRPKQRFQLGIARATTDGNTSQSITQSGDLLRRSLNRADWVEDVRLGLIRFVSHVTSRGKRPRPPPRSGQSLGVRPV